MSLVLPASSSLNFLAGIFAGAGINLITSVATGPEADMSTGKIALDALLWVLAAAFLTWAAQVVQHGERDADLHIDRDFSEPEKVEIREQHRRKAMKKARMPLLLTVVSLLAAFLLLPRLIQWSVLF
jgi:hypothetical protein